MSRLYFCCAYTSSEAESIAIKYASALALRNFRMTSCDCTIFTFITPKTPTRNRRAHVPVDLDIRVTVSRLAQGNRLGFTLHSPSGAANFHYQRLEGPEIPGNLDVYQKELVEHFQKLNSGMDIDGSPLLAAEISEKLESIGRQLYLDLFPHEMRAAYRSFRKYVRTIQVTSDEPWIPWELIKPYDDEIDPVLDDDFLCIRFMLTRWLAGRKTPKREIRVKKLAFFSAGDQMALASVSADRDLIAALAEENADVEDATPALATFEAVRELLLAGGASLLHFASPTSNEDSDPGLLLTDGRSLRARDLVGPLQRQINVDRPFIFLNFAPSRSPSFAALARWAHQWIDTCGSGAFVGPLWALRDKSAYRFAQEFYRNVREGRNLGEATNRARSLLREQNPGDPSFLAYSVYGDPNSVLALGHEGVDEESIAADKAQPESARLITRSIEFQPDHYQAGLTILSYFGTIVRQKYPGKKISIKIEQEDLLIRMIIETPEGVRDELEETLEDYGLVVQGQKEPQDLLNNELEIAELRHQLRLANVQLESQKELYSLGREHSRKRLDSLEREVKWLRSHVGSVLSFSEKHVAAFDGIFSDALEAAGQSGSALRSALSLLGEKLDAGLESSDEDDVKAALSTVREENRTVFESVRSRLEELIIKGSISGASGNLLYEWLKSLL